VRRNTNPKKANKTQNQKTNGMGMVGVLGDDRCVILSMHNRGSAAPDDQENRSAGSLHSRLLAGAPLSMGHIPVASAAPDFPEARQLRFLARHLKPTNRTAAVLPSRRHERVIDSHYKARPDYHRRPGSAKGLQPFDWPQAAAQGCDVTSFRCLSGCT
jgi:hypothetical protein